MLITTIIAIGILVFVTYTLLKNASKADRESMLTWKLFKDKTFTLTDSEAEISALLLLNDSELFHCTLANEESSRLPLDCPQAVRELLEKYESIIRTDGTARIDRSFIRPYVGGFGYVQVGEDSGSTVLAAKETGPAIYVLDGSEMLSRGEASSVYPSIYHWIIVASWVVR